MQVPVNIDQIVLAGGLDQITPTLSLKGGLARYAVNFECAVTGGYTRIVGYERFDGQTAPSDPTQVTIILLVDAVANTPSVGQTLTSSGGATGVLAYLSGLKLALVDTTGTFADDETLTGPSGVIGTITTAASGPDTPQEQAFITNASADIFRSRIAAVPGSGRVLGVVSPNDVVYAFRNNSGGTAADLYKSTSSGWSKVALLYTVVFSAGTTVPAEGATLTKGGVTATVKRVMLESGAWTGDAAGQLVITAPTGGDFSAGAATIGSTTITLAGVQTAIVLPAGGSYEFVVTNFAGQESTTRIYGVNGVGTAFEFDGTTLAPIRTGATSDKPTHICAHRNYLWLGMGSSAMHSAPGLPFCFSALAGAGEIATGHDVTGMLSMASGTSTSSMGIFSRNNIGVLYGTSPDDFNLVTQNTGTGALASSLQSMAQTLAFDDRGAVAVQTALQYGNFTQTTLTNSVLPFINEHIDTFTCAILNRRKSQYRLFFEDGAGLYITIVNGKLSGSMPVLFPNPVRCTWEGKLTTGEDYAVFGSDEGFVYQMDKGSSFDGQEIEYFLQLNFSAARSARTLKRYRKAALELSAESSQSVAYVEFKAAAIIGYDSSEYSQPVSASFASFVGSSRWDSFTWDEFFWDTNGLEPTEMYLEGTAENMALLVYGSADYVSSFTINSGLVHYTPRRMMR